jgi:hypothetical protein
MRKVKPKQDEYMTGTPVGLSKKKSEPRFPTIRLDHDTLPEAKDWKVGTTYHVEMDLKMVSTSQSRFSNDSEFEIRGIETESEAEEEAEDGPDTAAEKE